MSDPYSPPSSRPARVDMPFKFKWLDDEGNETGFFSKKGHFNGQTLTIDELAETARRFGLGTRTGLELAESPGLVPDSDFYDERFGPRRWTRGVLLNNVIGQGELLTTPLQIARTFAAIGGDGHLYRPSLILARENASGVRELRRVRRVSEPVCDPSIRRFLKEAMLGVVADDAPT